MSSEITAALNPRPFVNRSEDFLAERRRISIDEISRKSHMHNELRATAGRGVGGVASGTVSALGGAEPM